MKRGRNQRRRPSGGSNPNRALDSNGPDVRIRGTATQIYDKYQALARDASSSGDRVKAESYLQHAEHYHRLIRSMQPAQSPNQQVGGQDNDSDQPGMDDDGDDENHNTHNHNNGHNQRDSRPAREPREHREHRDNGAAEPRRDDVREQIAPAAPAPAAASPEASSSAANDGDTDEERKPPRRRRAPRKPAAEKEAAKPTDKSPAAAE